MTEMNGATGSSTGAPASLAEELPAPVSPDEDATAAVENAETLVVIGLGEDLGAAAITAGPLHNLLDEQRTPVGRLDESVPAAVEEDTPDAPHSQAPRTPWMPASLDVEDSRRRAIRRQRHVSFGARAAAAVMVVALVGGGAYLVVGSTINGSGGSSSAASTSLAQLPPAAGDTGTLHSPPTTLPKPKAVEQPPAGALVLQLRSTAGPVSCSEKTPIGVVFKDGTLQRVDPSPTKPAVMQVPGGSGVCIEVGAAFATAWSGDVIDVSVRAITGPDAPTSTASGVPVHLVFTLEPAAIADAATMSSALAGRLTVSVIGQGADLGTATVTKGSVVTLTASNFVATLLRELLLPHKAS
jgi:hypothetical protein